MNNYAILKDFLYVFSNGYALQNTKANLLKF